MRGALGRGAVSSGREGLVVLGLPRSGTTLLRRLLDAHPAVACPPESHLLRGAARMLAVERTGAGVEVGVVPALVDRGFAEEEVVERVRGLVLGFFREGARAAGKRWWAEKTPLDVFHLPEVERLCAGRAAFVVVVRHGLDQAASLEEYCAKTRGYHDEIFEWVRRDPVPLRAFVAMWIDRTRALLDLAARRPGEAVVVRYEDLVADPERELARILALLGEEVPEGLAARALEGAADTPLGDWKTWATAGIEATSVGRHAALPGPLRAELGAMANEMLLAAGYPAVDTSVDTSPAELRRRVALGLRLAGLRR